MVDEVNPASDFAQFRQQLREAVLKRDAELTKSSKSIVKSRNNAPENGRKKAKITVPSTGGLR
ncbi:hypothetical protein [Coleofasciculus sp. H7-2]|uniref:hypothetical protein n=1 Tax=Coleofasciculus sp. H7-2 TaxID=3351545 RepID=UPI00366C54F1